jgi:exodeoxyribonuclease III
MLLISWNVAGLATTVNRIHDSYSTSCLLPTGVESVANCASDAVATVNSNKNGYNHQNRKDATSNTNRLRKKPTQSASAALAEYMKRHQVDIFCLQEHKIPLSQLSGRSEPRGCSMVKGYESFWSCCVDPSKQGFNGVVTYVKKGMVQAADSRPLGSPDLDDQGRCIMTDHGKFVVFNVYAPCAGGHPLRYKMKFLRALRRAMDQQRTIHKKAVILVGDLNLKHTKLDLFWSDRAIFVEDVLNEAAAAIHGNQTTTNGGVLPQWKYDLAQMWPRIVKALETKQVVETRTSNSLTNQNYDKFRLTVTTVDGRKIFLGKHESAPEYCTWRYHLDAWTYKDPDTEEDILAEEENVISIDVLSELMSKIGSIPWDEATQRSIAKEYAGVSRVAPTRQWINAVIEQDGMFDAFRHFYPTAEGRYTCWNQFTNRRYVNEGARIDYTLVDATLLAHVQKGGTGSLRCGWSSQEQRHKQQSNEDPLSEAAALGAATARGRFQPVSFQGGGIVEASQGTLDTQFGAPHTGMIYTPPSFSDHIGVSLLLDDSCCAWDLVLDERDPATKKAQPHASQKTIASFFGAASSSSAGVKAAAPDTSANRAAATTQNKKRGIQSFFTASATFNGDKCAKGSASHGTSSKQTTSTVRKTKKSASILDHFVKQE